MDNNLALQNQDYSGDHFPWDAMPGETPEKFDAFRRFRDIPPSSRSIGELIRNTSRLGSDTRSYENKLRRWAKKYHWLERCMAWDSHLDKIWQGEQMAAVREAARRHLYESQQLQEKGMSALKFVDPIELAEKPQEVRRFITEGAELEKDTLGMSNQDSGDREITVVNPVLVIKLAEELEDRMATIDLPAEDYEELEGA